MAVIDRHFIIDIFKKGDIMILIHLFFADKYMKKGANYE